jgi:hypothetical protein
VNCGGTLPADFGNSFSTALAAFRKNHLKIVSVFVEAVTKPILKLSQELSEKLKNQVSGPKRY